VIRQAVVSRLIDATEDDTNADEFAALLAQATHEEISVAGHMLAAKIVARDGPPPADGPPSLLSLDLAGLTRSAGDDFRRGAAKAWLRDQLDPLWAARPTATLGDLAKIAPPDRLGYFRAELLIAGLRLDGDDDGR
jgi:hypothetical protein